MKLRTFSTSAAVAAAIMASSAAQAVTLDFAGAQQFGNVSGQLVLDVNRFGQVTDGYATIGGAGLSGVQTLGVIAYSSYGGTTGYRSGDGTDIFGGDTAWPIDGNGLIFGSNPGSTGGYAFAIWSDDSSQGPYGGQFETWLSGPGGAGNFYHDSGANSFTLSVPEPATWATMLAGFAALAFAGHRKARAVA
jgi:hypothetical protein